MLVSQPAAESCCNACDEGAYQHGQRKKDRGLRGGFSGRVRIRLQLRLRLHYVGDETVDPSLRIRFRDAGARRDLIDQVSAIRVGNFAVDKSIGNDMPCLQARIRRWRAAGSACRAKELIDAIPR